MSVWLLRKLRPSVVLTLVVVASAGMVGVLRIVWEGRFYDYSRASLPGDILIGCELAIVSAELRGGNPSGYLYRSRIWHGATFATCLLSALALQIHSINQSGRLQTAANAYHNLVVVSTLGYFVISTIPIVLGSPRRTKAAAGALLLTWLGLLIFDITQGNLQRNSPLTS